MRLLILALFAIIIKISTIPLLLFFVAPFVLYKNAVASIAKTYVFIGAIALLILIPWLGRNALLSGYLLFPFPSIDVFSFDWKVPLDVTIAEKQHVSHAPRLVSNDWNYVSSLSFTQWFPIWIKEIWTDNKLNALLVYLTFMSAIPSFIYLLKRKAHKKHFITYFIALAAILFWLLGSPDIRFGYHYFIPFIFFPILMIAKNKSLPVTSFTSRVFAFITVVVVAYYGFIAIKMLMPYHLKEYIVKPLRSQEYNAHNDLSTFKFALLNDSIKLFFHDPEHHTLNAPLPSSDKFRPGIKMRGSTLQDGFMITTEK